VRPRPGLRAPPPGSARGVASSRVAGGKSFQKNPTIIKKIATFCKMLAKIVHETNISLKC
jgi:hypothetical protein